MKKPLLSFGLLCIAAGTIAQGMVRVLVPSLAPTNREEALGVACVQILFILTGVVLIVVHFVRGAGGKQDGAWPPRVRRVVVNCPGCHWEMKVPGDSLGEKVHCQVCHRRFVARVDEDESEEEEDGREEEKVRRDGGVPLWVWLTGGAVVFLLLAGGLVLVLYLQGAFGPPAPRVLPGVGNPPQGQRPPNAPGGLPGEQFGIRIGMTEAELTARLGPPAEEKNEPGKKQLKWVKDRQLLWVTLIDGKASGISLSPR